MPTLSSLLKSMLIAATLALMAAAVFVYSGIYPIGADVPHNAITYRVLETLREQSIARAASDIQVPQNLDTPDRLLSGGADYNDMCAGCHLKPGKKQSDLAIGLYPSPPNLTASADTHGHSHGNHGDDTSDNSASMQRQFWIIKHGIKASGMPAWGPTHSDERIWNMVAFLQRLPDLSPEQYQILTARGNAVITHDH